VLLLAVVLKEFLSRRVFAAGNDFECAQSDAWHHRSDAITSAAAIDITVALIGDKGYES